MTSLFYLIYAAFACFLLWPALVQFGQVVPGAEISDLWNTLWSIDFFVESVQKGESPTCTSALNYPKGGCLWPNDILGALLAAPFLLFLPLAESYTVVVLLQLCLIGLATDTLFRLLYEKASDTQAFFSGLMMMSSTAVSTSIHNGSSEALSIGWAILAMVGIVQWCQGKRVGLLWLIMGTFSSWYAVLGVALFALCYGYRLEYRHKLFLLMGIWGVILLPYAWWVQSLSTGGDNLVLIKGEMERMQVRRTIGAADPLGYILPFEYRSPDFEVISRYGEQFVHSTYVGIIALGILCWKWKEYPRNIALLAIIAFVLSLGPVLVIQGEPLILRDSVAIPLPYLLLEKLPGFSGLTLLYRLSFIPMLCLALLIPRGWANRGLLLLGGLLCFESSLISPVREVPSFASVPPTDTALKLRDAPEGAVGHYPIVGGREYLYFQTIHRKPIAGSLNFPLNGALEKIFRTAVKAENNPSDLQRRVKNVAKQTGIRYLLVDTDPTIMPDQYSTAIQQMLQEFPSVDDAQNDYIVLQLW